MQRPFRIISVDLAGDVFCVRLRSTRIDHHQLDELGSELARLLDEENCRKMVLNLGPEEPECLVSVFLAKLINLQRRLEAVGGGLTLAHASEYTRNIFRIAGIERFFHFYSDEKSAIQAWNPPA